MSPQRDDDIPDDCSAVTRLDDDREQQFRKGVSLLTETSVKSAISPPVGIPGTTTLVSSDGVKFHVPSVLLMMASPLFNDTPRSSNPNISPVVTMSGVSAATLDTILRYLYPITPKPKLKDVNEAASLATVARKYQLAAVENSILADVTILLDAEPNPLRAWASAIACGADVARKAAMIRFLQVEDEDFDSVKRQAHSALAHATAQQLYDLEEWRATAIEQARQAITTTKVEGYNAAQRSTFANVVAGHIGKVNPFLHFDIFLPILVRVVARAGSLDGQWMRNPEGRQKISETIRAEVQMVLSRFRCKPLMLIFKASKLPIKLALKHTRHI